MKVARGWFGGDQDFDLHPKLFTQLFDQFVGTFGAAGVHHMAMTHFQFQGTEILFAEHVDVGGHGFENDELETKGSS